MEKLFTTQEVLESWNKSCKVNDDVDQQVKDIIREALELKIAEEQGFILRLLCKVGDTIWAVIGNQIKGGVVDRIEMNSQCTKVSVKNRSWLCNIESVCLTYEEAEQKLAEMKEV